MAQIFLCIWLLLSCLWGSGVTAGTGADEERGPIPASKRNIKGQQFVRQSAVARLVGGPVPPELLKIIQSNATLPPGHEPPVDIKKVPHLITDEVKTTITRMVIPLTTSYADSERYLAMLRKFLVRNHVNLTHTDRLESPNDVAPSTSAIALKLQAAANLKANLITILGNILALPEGLLPPHHHAPLAYIQRFLQLRRIPVVDLLEHTAKLGKPIAQEQWLTVFSELEKHIPPYMKSCTTFLLESLQEKHLVMDEILENIKDANSPKLLTGILYQGGQNNPANRPLLFPKRILSAMKKNQEETLGRTMGAMLATVTENRRNFSPRLLALFLLHLPRNTPNPDFDEKAFAIAYSQEIVLPQELAAVATAFERNLPSNAHPNQIFHTILKEIVNNKFDGYKKYDELLNDFQISSEVFAL